MGGEETIFLFEHLFIFLVVYPCIHFVLHMFSQTVADFGVSAKGMKVQNGRDTYIGTPYW